MGSRRTWSSSVSQASMAKAFGLADVAALSLAHDDKDLDKDGQPDGDLTLLSATATSSKGVTKTLTASAFRAAVPTTSAWVEKATPVWTAP